MQENTILSVVVPVYNVAPYLSMSIDSLRAQSLNEIEVICVNDASTDESLAILTEYSGKDPRVKILNQPINNGLAVARNRGVQEARGEFIAFVDADDWLNPDMYQIMHEEAVKNNADIVLCGIEQYDADGQTRLPRACSYCKSIPKSLDNGVFTWREIQGSLFNLLPVCWNRIYRRSFLEKNSISFLNLGANKRGTGEERFSGLVYSYTTLLTAQKIKFVRQRLYKWRRRQGAITSGRSSRPEGIFDAIGELGFLLQRPEYTDEIRRYFEAAKVTMLFKQLNKADTATMPSYYQTMKAELKSVDVNNPFLSAKHAYRLRIALKSDLSEYLAKRNVPPRAHRLGIRKFLSSYAATLCRIGVRALRASRQKASEGNQ